MKLIKAIGIPNNIENQETNGNPKRQAQDMNARPEFVPSEISPGDLKVVFEHGFNDFKIEKLKDFKIEICDVLSCFLSQASSFLFLMSCILVLMSCFWL